ncbi:MAG: DUF4837 family protein [Mediterranea sp.]|jgi:hypothetical protein|nr:DUF4837 family protein [Mediterranea sp.]
MKKNLSLAGMTLVLIVLLGSCGMKSGNTSSGRAYELLVVVDHDLWERPAGRALHDVLDSDVPGLPQSEPAFSIMYTSPKNYDSVLKLIRNIIIVDIQDIYTKVTLKYVRNEYASPQMVLTIQAPNEAEFMKYVTDNKQAIVGFFTKAEMNRQIDLLKDEHSTMISAKVDSIFGCDIWLPGELASYKVGKDFFWASNNTEPVNLNFVMYSYPYRDEDTFTTPYFIHKRDSVMAANIPGERPGTYMSTDSLLTDTRAITVNKDYAMEARGLWKMKGDFMGGPYVSHSRVDQKNQRVITVEVFVYSPSKSKANNIRRMEASLYTLKLPGERPLEQIAIDGEEESKPEVGSSQSDK